MHPFILVHPIHTEAVIISRRDEIMLDHVSHFDVVWKHEISGFWQNRHIFSSGHRRMNRGDCQEMEWGEWTGHII